MATSNWRGEMRWNSKTEPQLFLLSPVLLAGQFTPSCLIWNAHTCPTAEWPESPKAGQSSYLPQFLPEYALNWMCQPESWEQLQENRTATTPVASFDSVPLWSSILPAESPHGNVPKTERNLTAVKHLFNCTFKLAPSREIFLSTCCR